MYQYKLIRKNKHTIGLPVGSIVVSDDTLEMPYIIARDSANRSWEIPTLALTEDLDEEPINIQSGDVVRYVLPHITQSSTSLAGSLGYVIKDADDYGRFSMRTFNGNQAVVEKQVERVSISEGDKVIIAYYDDDAPYKHTHNETHLRKVATVKSISRGIAKVEIRGGVEHDIHVCYLDTLPYSKPKVDDTVYYKDSYLRVMEIEDDTLTLYGDVKAKFSDVELYRIRNTSTFVYGNNLSSDMSLMNKYFEPLETSLGTDEVCGRTVAVFQLTTLTGSRNTYIIPMDLFEDFSLESDIVFIPDTIKEQFPNDSCVFNARVDKVTMFSTDTVYLPVLYNKSDKNFKNATTKSNYGGGGRLSGNFTPSPRYGTRNSTKWSCKGGFYKKDDEVNEILDRLLKYSDYTLQNIRDEKYNDFKGLFIPRSAINKVKNKLKIKNG